MFKKLLLVMVVVGSACAMDQAAGASAPAAKSAPVVPTPVVIAPENIFIRTANGTIHYAGKGVDGIWFVGRKVDEYTGVSTIASKDEWTGHYLKNVAKVVVCAALLYGAYKLLTHKKATPSEPIQTIVNEAAEATA